MTPVFIFEWCRRGDLNGFGPPTNRRKSATHGSASGPNPAAKAEAMEGRPHSRTKRAPLGYPATNSPRGKAQAGKSPFRHI
jgi:hypothetical protein